MRRVYQSPSVTSYCNFNTLMMSYRGRFLTAGVQSDFSQGHVLRVLTHLTSGRFWAEALGTWMV